MPAAGGAEIALHYERLPLRPRFRVGDALPLLPTGERYAAMRLTDWLAALSAPVTLPFMDREDSVFRFQADGTLTAVLGDGNSGRGTAGAWRWSRGELSRDPRWRGGGQQLSLARACRPCRVDARMTAAFRLRGVKCPVLLGACLAAMVAASGASALDAVSPSAPGTQSAEAVAVGSARVNSKPALSVPPMAPSTGAANAPGRSRLLRVLEGGAAENAQPAGRGEEARPPNVPAPNSGIPIPPMAASVIAGCPRDLLTRLLAGVANKEDALSALAIEQETLKLCHERQLIVSGIFETEAQLRALRAPAEPAPQIDPRRWLPPFLQSCRN